VEHLDTLARDRIYVPRSSGYGGVTDRYTLMPSELVIKAWNQPRMHHPPCFVAWNRAYTTLHYPHVLSSSPPRIVVKYARDLM
jgi:hypothetical protein